VTHDIRAVLLAILMPEAAIYYGLLMAKVAPDVALIPFAVAMVWALVGWSRATTRAGGLPPACSLGLALLSKFTAVMAGSGHAGVHADSGLAAALAEQPVSGAAAAIAGRAVLAGADLEMRSTTGPRSDFNPCAR